MFQQVWKETWARLYVCFCTEDPGEIQLEGWAISRQEAKMSENWGGGHLWGIKIPLSAGRWFTLRKCKAGESRRESWAVNHTTGCILTVTNALNLLPLDCNASYCCTHQFGSNIIIPPKNLGFFFSHRRRLKEIGKDRILIGKIISPQQYENNFNMLVQQNHKETTRTSDSAWAVTTCDPVRKKRAESRSCDEGSVHLCVCVCQLRTG